MVLTAFLVALFLIRMRLLFFNQYPDNFFNRLIESYSKKFLYKDYQLPTLSLGVLLYCSNKDCKNKPVSHVQLTPSLNFAIAKIGREVSPESYFNAVVSAIMMAVSSTISMPSGWTCCIISYINQDTTPSLT